MEGEQGKEKDRNKEKETERDRGRKRHTQRHRDTHRDRERERDKDKKRQERKKLPFNKASHLPSLLSSGAAVQVQQKWISTVFAPPSSLHWVVRPSSLSGRPPDSAAQAHCFPAGTARFAPDGWLMLSANNSTFKGVRLIWNTCGPSSQLTSLNPTPHFSVRARELFPGRWGWLQEFISVVLGQLPPLQWSLLYQHCTSNLGQGDPEYQPMCCLWFPHFPMSLNVSEKSTWEG